MRGTTRHVLSAALILAAAPAVVRAAGDEPNLFNGTLYQAIAAITCFLLLLVILKKMAWGPILKGLQDREAKIKSDIEQAHAANTTAQTTLAEYEKKLADAHAEARTLVDKARSDADAFRKRLEGEAEVDIAKQRDRATQEIHNAKQAAVQELYAHAGELAVAVAGKILSREINAADTQRLVEQSLGELGKLEDAG